MPKLKSSKLFSYGWVTDKTRADYDAMLDADALSFVQWMHRTQADASMTLKRRFSAWWLTKGPTAFATPDDAFRYKRELFDRAVLGTVLHLRGASIGPVVFDNLTPKCDDPACGCERCRCTAGVPPHQVYSD